MPRQIRADGSRRIARSRRARRMAAFQAAKIFERRRASPMVSGTAITTGIDVVGGGGPGWVARLEKPRLLMAGALRKGNNYETRRPSPRDDNCGFTVPRVGQMTTSL